MFQICRWCTDGGSVLDSRLDIRDYSGIYTKESWPLWVAILGNGLSWNLFPRNRCCSGVDRLNWCPSIQVAALVGVTVRVRGMRLWYRDLGSTLLDDGWLY
uniref:Transmembrane protein n=1 Tax=Haemonchus placei TaxID=6290 RepID=A0A0N4WJF1_HAEPC